MYEPRKVLEKYQKKLFDLLGVDVSKVRSFSQVEEDKLKEEKSLNRIQQALKRKFQMLLEKNSKNKKAPDVDAMLRETKLQARSLKLARKK